MQRVLRVSIAEGGEAKGLSSFSLFALMGLHLVHVTVSDARGFVARVHRHLPRVVSALYAVGVARESGELVGVALMGRPVAPALDDGATLEVTRCAVVEDLVARNACSMLYGAARRAGKALGFGVVQTYTRPDEPGSSLRGAGFVPAAKGTNRNESGVVRWEVRFVELRGQRRVRRSACACASCARRRSR